MFFGGNNGVLGAPIQQQGVNELQGYERRMNPGQGRVLSSNPMSYGQPGMQLTPQTNPFNPGQPPPAGMTPPVSGGPVTAPLPQGAGGMPVPAGATPPFNPGESGVPDATAPDTGDPVVDGMLQNGMLPTSIPLKSEMSLGQKMSALGMVLSAAGTPQFGQVAGTVNAGIMQRTQGIEKYNRDLMALTKPRTVQKEINNQLFEATIQPSYKYNPDTNSLDQLPPSPSPEWTQVLDARDTPEEPKREIKTDGNGNQRYVDDGSYVFDDQIPNPDALKTMTSEARGTTARYVNELYEKRIAPIEDALDKADKAVSYADVFYEKNEKGELKSTKAQRTQADRALIKAVEKLWDENSAVLQGEFESAESAQDIITQLQRGADPTSGEVLGDEARAAMLDIIQRASGDMMDKYNRGAEEVYLAAKGGFSGFENYDNNINFAVPQLSRWMNGEEFVGRQQSDSWAGLNNSDWYQAALNRAAQPFPNLEKQAAELLRVSRGKFDNRAGR